MRFCLVSTQTNWGGGETLAWTIGQELQALGHQVAWMAKTGSELAKRIVDSGDAILHLHSGKGLAPRDWLATLHALRDWAPDAVIANDTHAVHLAGSTTWFCRRPWPIRLAYKHTIFPLRSKIKYRFLTDKIVCVSKAAQQVVESGGVPKSNTAVIYGGCTSPRVDSNARAMIDREFGLKATDYLLVCVGNLLACKGHTDLITAVSQLAETQIDYRLLIAGEGKERERLASHIHNLGLSDRVQLLGYRDDANCLLAAADLVVHPSLSEGLSLVLIQAQMLLKPIVATAVGGTIEVLAADSPEFCTAWLAEAGDSTSLAKQIGLARQQLTRYPEELYQKRIQTAQRTHATFDLRNNVLRLVELARNRPYA
jgi:L-malate glycosyltransferase